MFRVGVNHWCSCTQPSKRGGVARQGSLCSCKSSGPDVQREGGGGKTNISLLESSAEWASALKNINNTRRNTKKFRRGGEEGERRRRSTSLPAEALCSGGVNCKRNICQRGCFELPGRKKIKINSLQQNVSLHIYAAGAEEWDGPSHEV